MSKEIVTEVEINGSRYAMLLFKLPDEKESLDQALRAGAVESGIWDFANFLRTRVKHAVDPSDEVLEERTEIRQMLYDCMDGRIELP